MNAIKCTNCGSCEVNPFDSSHYKCVCCNSLIPRGVEDTTKIVKARVVVDKRKALLAGSSQYGAVCFRIDLLKLSQQERELLIDWCQWWHGLYGYRQMPSDIGNCEEYIVGGCSLTRVVELKEEYSKLCKIESNMFNDWDMSKCIDFNIDGWFVRAETLEAAKFKVFNRKRQAYDREILAEGPFPTLEDVFREARTAKVEAEKYYEEFKAWEKIYDERQLNKENEKQLKEKIETKCDTVDPALKTLQALTTPPPKVPRKGFFKRLFK